MSSESPDCEPPLKRLILVDPLAPVCVAWRAAFRGYPEVDVVNGRFEDLPEFDCVVAAANCYGIMDGGVDMAIRERFPAVEAHVQKRIADEFHGYQPVGTCLLIPTGDPEHPWVAHAPTMGVPAPLVKGAARQVHSALWAVLCAVRQHNDAGGVPIEILACPGLGTFHGRLPPEQAARLMALAYESHRRGPIKPTWPAAREHEQQLRL